MITKINADGTVADAATQETSSAQAAADKIKSAANSAYKKIKDKIGCK